MSGSRIMLALASPRGVDSPILEKVLRLTAALDAELELFHCVSNANIAKPRSAVQQDIRTFIAQRRQQLEHHAQCLRAGRIRVASSVHWDDSIPQGIVRHALEYKPDLLIVQPSRHHGRWAFGDSDYKLIETCPCPLLLIKTRRPYVACRVVAAVDPFHEHDKPAALDEAILEAAATIAKALCGSVLVFHARMPWPSVIRAELPLPLREDAEGAYCRSVITCITRLTRRHNIGDDQVKVVEGPAVESLPAFARDAHADIVVMGAVSRSLLNRILIGHTAEQLLDSLDCDMLIVKPPGFRSPVSLRSNYHIEHAVA